MINKKILLIAVFFTSQAHCLEFLDDLMENRWFKRTVTTGLVIISAYLFKKTVFDLARKKFSDAEKKEEELTSAKF